MLKWHEKVKFDLYRNSPKRAIDCFDTTPKDYIIQITKAHLHCPESILTLQGRWEAGMPGVPQHTQYFSNE